MCKLFRLSRLLKCIIKSAKKYFRKKLENITAAIMNNFRQFN